MRLLYGDMVFFRKGAAADRSGAIRRLIAPYDLYPECWVGIAYRVSHRKNGPKIQEGALKLFNKILWLSLGGALAYWLCTELATLLLSWLTPALGVVDALLWTQLIQLVLLILLAFSAIS